MWKFGAILSNIYLFLALDWKDVSATIYLFIYFAEDLFEVFFLL